MTDWVSVVVVLIFCLFNLTAVVDQSAVVRTLAIAVVNDDEGVAAPGAGTVRLADQAIAALERQLPLRMARFGDLASATDALDHGVVVAVLGFPPEFTATAVAGEPPPVQLVNSDHLSVLETQIGRQLPQQIQAGMSLFVLAARPQLAALRPFVEPALPATAPAAAAARRAPGDQSPFRRRGR